MLESYMRRVRIDFDFRPPRTSIYSPHKGHHSTTMKLCRFIYFDIVSVYLDCSFVTYIAQFSAPSGVVKRTMTSIFTIGFELVVKPPTQHTSFDFLFYP
jgi:hypothetical protein